MTAQILAFPRRLRVKPRPRSVSDLAPGAKALTIRAEGDGFIVFMVPAITNADRALFRKFLTVDQARSFVRDTSIAHYGLYQLIIDETLQRPTLGEIMGDDPSPRGGGWAA